MHTLPDTPTLTRRVEQAALVVILLVVGVLAGLASFTHVHDWTMENSPAGTPDWFGWANAAISELIPVAAMLTVRQRRRTRASVAYPMFLLVCAVALSLAAQLAVAKPGLSGWLLSAVPALAFMGLSKLVLSGKVDVDELKPQVTDATARDGVMPPVVGAEPAVAASPGGAGAGLSELPAGDAVQPVVRVRPRVTTTAPKVQAVAARMPDATPAQIAAKAGVSESTARRYMPRPGVTVASPTMTSPGQTASVNGRDPGVLAVAFRSPDGG